MARNRYTDEQKAEALRIYQEHGAGEAARRTGIARVTISSWAKRTPLQPGVATDATVATQRTEQVRASVEVAALTRAQKRDRLVDDLLDDVQWYRQLMRSPTLERKVVTLSGGKDSGAMAEIVDVERDLPTFGDMKNLMWMIGVSIDKVQLLSGEATERHEQLSRESAVAKFRAFADELQERKLRMIEGGGGA
jgi:transposase-like protein